jgi:hypothetical protein
MRKGTSICGMRAIVPSSRDVIPGLRALVPGLALLTACATAPAVPSPAARALLARAEIVAASDPPRIAFQGFAHGKLEGAGIGASSWFTGCVIGVLGGGSCEGAVCGAALLFGLGFCTASGAVGGVAGAVRAPSAREVRAVEAELEGVLGRNPVQESLRREVVAAARANAGWQETPAERSGARLEVALTRVGSEGQGIEGPLLLYMTARARLLRAGEDTPSFEAEFRHEGERRTLAEWSADAGTPLLRALEYGYLLLGAQIFERLFVLYPFPDHGTHWGFLRSHFGLAALDPTPGLSVPEVEDLRPTLRWQSFPRASDLAAAPAEMGRVQHVRYDLRVARVFSGARAAVVYRRDGLAARGHTLEESLVAGSLYLWSVRARFRLDGRVHVTEWSGVGPVGASEPESWWFRFQTP